MNTKWSLNDIYISFQDLALIQDKKQLKAYAKQLNDMVLTLSNEDSINTIKQILRLFEKYTSLYSRIVAFASLSQSVNTQNQDAIQCLQELEKINQSCVKAISTCEHYIQDVLSMEQLQQDLDFKPYQFYLKTLIEDKKYRLSEEVEEVIQIMNENAGKAWEKLQEFLTSSLFITFQGNEYTLSEIRNFSHDANPQLRKEAYNAELNAYSSISESVAFSLNSIKSQVSKLCNLRGFSSALQQTLHYSHMQQQTLDALLEAIQESLPYFHRYLRQKAKLLTNESTLAWYDLFAPLFSDVKTYSIEEAKAYLIAELGTIDPDVQAFTKHAFDNQWIDFLPYKQKVGGAFCLNLPSIRQSRILTNFQGKFSDVLTLAHELGHAYHGSMIEKHSPLTQDYPMPLAETASTFQELYVMQRKMKQETDPIQKLSYLESHLQDATQILCDIYSRFLFEKDVFEKRNHQFLFAKDLCEQMKNAQKQAYGDAIKEETLHPYMWINKSHYYSPFLSYYNFPYAFGGLLARGLLQRLESKQLTFQQYQLFLSNTSIMSIEDCCKLVGIDISNIEFWRECLQSYKDEIDHFIEETNALK